MTGAFEGRKKISPLPLLGMGCEQRDKHLVAHLIPINLTMPEEARVPKRERALQAADIARNMPDTDNRQRICDINVAWGVRRG
jgi:hypothetical protein